MRRVLFCLVLMLFTSGCAGRLVVQNEYVNEDDCKKIIVNCKRDAYELARCYYEKGEYDAVYQVYSGYFVVYE